MEVDQVKTKKTEANYGFKLKKGSVFPAKRKLVKKMVFDSMVEWASSVFCPALFPPPSSSAANITKVPNSKKCKQIVGQRIHQFVYTSF
ncbi:PREDICTED: PRUPE_1G487200 [Prunus dulcis]|uniref:PREDICTED: PRUPE_1G487200 n=1 Tax=Prunus dulcis TaxID=3755 RepID=A0A5E4EET6_PRUDU|nr:PREDICTED: PRUPE_1G487200 [Prunus dulcis]